MIQMKLKNKYYSLLVLYVCSWPGLEDRSSGPGSIVSRSLSRGFEFVSLSSSIHVGFFFARERNHDDDDDDSTKKYVKES